MKKPILFATLAGSCIAAVAQQAGPVNKDRVLRTHKADGHQYANERPAPAPSNGMRGAAFWSEDFSGGSIPSGWTNVDNGTTGGDPDVVFVWSNDPAAVGPSALGYAPSAIFNGGTASNGFLWADSDRGLPSAPASNHITQLTTPAIDCSGQSTVLLTFESLIGVFDLDANENAIVRVSTDLTNWTTYEAFPCLVTGSAAPPCSRWSSNPQQVSINISATAANEPMVYIQWQWTGGWEYFWALDDIALSLLPDYERSVSAAYMSHVGEGLEYHRIPTDQFLSDFTLGLSVFNGGANDQNNVTLSAVMTDDMGTEILSASENLGTLTTGQSDTMEVAVPIPSALTPGIYTVTFSVSSDENDLEANPDNDVIVRTFEVNDDVYSLDGLGVHPTALENTTSLGSASFVGGADALYCLTYYEITEPTTVYGIEALLAANTDVDAEVIFTIHTAADVDADIINNPIAESDSRIITAADIAAGTVSDVFFTGPAVLAAGGYYAAVSLYSNANAADVSIVDDVTVPQPNGASLIHLPDGGFFTNGNALAIRLQLDPSVGIDEVSNANNMRMSFINGNISNGTTLMGYDVVQDGRMELLIHNTNGQVVNEHSFGVQGAGSYQHTINTNDWAAGMYYVTLKNNGQPLTKKLIVE